ncbi:MAG TPA: aminotransferase class I/II-fold pyridoxal phosphate-dependent enzyme [Candidatus Angelobacter sp.]|nr:aminotransferase class I/II-fold pyridoxal phosphate-dependent enzyme [Candidatus Angelobacter sp.]
MFYPFDLEHYQSQFERTVEYNLADSSVQCLNTRELVTEAEAQELLSVPLYYPEVNGTQLLRERIAGLYPGATPDNVLVTVGASQANSTICSTLLEPGDEIIVISPGYRQVWGLAKNLGCRVHEIQLHPENNWQLDLDLLDSVCNPQTKLVAIVNPNNPTGSILSAGEMRRIVEICRKNGAWLHADEVYRGTEFEAEETAGFWGKYGKVICVHSFSKAYGLAGVRIGWAVASLEMIQALWRRHEYAVIAASGPSMKLAEIALQRPKRQMLLDRQKNLSRRGHRILADWIAEQDGAFSVVPAAATSIAFVRYHFDMPSLEFAEHLRKKSSVLVAPGGFLGTEQHFRISVGYPAEKLQAALGRIAGTVGELKRSKEAIGHWV